MYKTQHNYHLHIALKTTLQSEHYAVVWMSAIPSVHVLKIWSPAGVIGMVELPKDRACERSLGHWWHASKKDCRTLAPSSVFHFLVDEVSGCVPPHVLAMMSICHRPKEIRPTNHGMDAPKP